MSQEYKHPSKPTQTIDLVRRLSAVESSLEKAALQAWSKTMIQIFANSTRNRDYLSEAVLLSTVAEGEELSEILRTSGNYIIERTADGDNIDPRILTCFSHIIRQTNSSLPASVVQFGPVLSSLHKRLDAAKANADLESQYQLISTLSFVLDAMSDVGISGLSRTTLHEPLLKLLRELADHQELRLAQTAGYAYQALLGVQDDETTSQAVWRHFGTITNSLLKTAGAVTSMDPGKLVDAGFNLEDIPDLPIKLKEAYDSLKSVIDGGKFKPKQKAWYRDLRYTEICLELGCLESVREFAMLEKRRQKEFLCGLFMQLEAYTSGRSGQSRQQALDLISEVLIKPESTYPRVLAWANLISKSLDQPGWLSKQQPVHRWQFKLKHTYEGTLKAMPAKEMESVGPLNSLLNEAWSNCEEAQLFYAIAALEEHYCSEKRLAVERISGDILPMDQCYINLAIVQRRREKADPKPTDHSLFARLKISSANEKDQVLLPKLLESRTLSNQSFGPPKRVLIEGAAGVGKTTLCKKIVHDYIYHKMWRQLYDCLIWLPLRKLKGKTGEAYNLNNLLYEEYFAHREEGMQLAIALKNAIDRQKKKVLFLLDGFDEINQEWAPDSALDRFLQYLLKQPRIIITSRPYRVDRDKLGQLDLELETIGFQPKQIATYTTTPEIIPSPEISKAIQTFIKGNPLIQGLVRIPIQLDALCSTWNEPLQGVSNTMTTIYQAIVLKLWKKDIIRLNKTVPGVSLNPQPVQNLDTDSQIRRIVPEEQNLLHGLALVGLYNDVIEFTRDHRRRVYESLDIRGYALPIYCETVFRRVSFLRTSDDTLEDEALSYHFLHLTFQEFFAARYFVDRWRANKDLCCAMISGQKQGKPKYLNASEFLRNEKYNSRYLILWRFAAGMIQETSDEELLTRFFRDLQDEPRDLLGPAHQRILMYCLAEIPPSESPTLSKSLQNIRKQLSDWVVFEYNTFQTVKLSSHNNFPEDLLIEIAKESETLKEGLWEVFERRLSLSSVTLDLLLCWLKESASRKGKSNLVCRLAGHCNSSTEITKTMIELLKDKDLDVRSTAAGVLGQHSELPQSILEALARCLKDEVSYVRSTAARALGEQSELPHNILEALARCLKDKNFRVKSAAAEALGQQSQLPQSILKELARCLVDKDEDSDVRSIAASALGQQSELPQSILEALARCLKDESLHVRKIAVWALGRQSELPQSILEALARCLKDEESYVRSIAASALSRQSKLPQSILEALARCLKDKESYVRSSAAKALGQQSELPQSILEALARCLKDESLHVRKIAVWALGRQSELPQSILEAVFIMLDKSEIREIAESCLCNQENFVFVLTRLDMQNWEYLYRCWLGRGFEENLQFHVRVGNLLSIETPKGLCEVKFQDKKQCEEFAKRIRSIQETYKMPET